ncbi:MAG: type II secretion system protein [Candidimonas sp.]|jgi:type II secretory pathway pseudopilin PulG
MTRASRCHALSSQRGFSLLELSVLIVLLGIGSVAFWQLSNLNRHQELQKQQEALLYRADQALAGYAFSHQRLPCPAETPTSGIEQCAGNRAIGYLPFTTLGLPDLDAGLIRYGVLRRPHGTQDAELTQRKPRLQLIHFNPGTELTTRITPSPHSDPQELAWKAGVYARDFCSALGFASALPFSESFVHIPKNGQEQALNVAYALALPKGSRQAEGAGSSFSSLGFDSPTSNLLSSQQDMVLAVSPQSLSARLSCAPLVAAVRSYANIQAAVAIHTRTLPDYLNQLDINVDKARAALIASSAVLLRATANEVAAIADIFKSKAKISRTSFYKPHEIIAEAASLPLKYFSLGSATASLFAISAGVPLAAKQSHDRATNNYNKVNDVLIPQANALKQAIDERMARTLQSGIYLPIHTTPSP